MSGIDLANWQRSTKGGIYANSRVGPRMSHDADGADDGPGWGRQEGPPSQPDPSQVTVAETPAGLPEGGVTVSVFTAEGVLLGTETAIAAYGTEPDVVAPASASGCLSVDAWRNKYTLLGFLAYRWHQTKYFCWSGGAVNSVTVGSYVSHNDGTNYYRGLLSQDSWYFSWSGNSRGGHYSIRQAIMENCVPVLGCLSTSYPYVKIGTYANGNWTYEVGG